jgi:hypothetical protein
VWNVAVAVVAAIAATATLLAGGSSVVAAVFGYAMFAFWVFALCFLKDVAARWRELLTASAAFALSAAAAVGLFLLLGAWAILVVAVTIATHPSIVLGITRPDDWPWRGMPSKLGIRGVQETLALAHPRRLNDARLRDAWERTWIALQTADLAATLRLVDYRRRCLDEFERRHPVSFVSWFAAGAPNAATPAMRLPRTFDVDPA